jgi:hypothetical protein
MNENVKRCVPCRRQRVWSADKKKKFFFKDILQDLQKNCKSFEQPVIGTNSLNSIKKFFAFVKHCDRAI